MCNPVVHKTISKGCLPTIWITSLHVEASVSSNAKMAKSKAFTSAINWELYPHRCWLHCRHAAQTHTERYSGERQQPEGTVLASADSRL
jgi:hypothetical protein